MSRTSLCSCVVLLALVVPAASALQTTLPKGPTEAALLKDADADSLGVDILSDTGGVDIGPYVKQVVGMVQKNWLSLLPEDTKSPQSKQGEALIRIKLLPDGRIGAMWLDGSTHDDAINRACWGAITRVGQFPPLPAALGSKALGMRIHFYVNLKAQ